MSSQVKERFELEAPAVATHGDGASGAQPLQADSPPATGSAQARASANPELGSLVVPRKRGQPPSPYYSQDGIVIYFGDNRRIIPLLGSFDLLLTDPPYGIGLDTKTTKQWKSKSVKWKGARLTKDYGVNEWDGERVEQWLIDLARARCKWQVIFGGNYYPLPPAKCWLVWDKMNQGLTFAECELAWTNLDKPVRLLHYLWNGFQKAKPEYRWHATQKPLDVISWALSNVPDDIQNVLDPFMGSGTTLLAAKNRGLRAVGIELEERHCETAARRLSQGVLWAADAGQCNGQRAFARNDRGERPARQPERKNE